MSASEKFFKDYLEVFYHLVEVFFKSGSDGGIHLADDSLQLLHGSDDIFTLSGQKFVPLADGFVFFNGAYIDVSQLSDSVSYLSALLDRGAHSEVLFSQIYSLGVGNLKVFPQSFLQGIHLGFVFGQFNLQLIFLVQAAVQPLIAAALLTGNLGQLFR